MSIKKTLGLLACLTLIFSNLAVAQITEIGLASFYADKFDGRITASGEIFNQEKMTGAHRTLPFGTKVKVTNTVNNKSVEVVINDRGPFVNDRVIDLSKSAAIKLDFVRKGVTKVKVEVMSLAQSKTTQASKSAPVAKSQATKEPNSSKKKKQKQEASVTVSGSASSQALSYYQVDSDLINPKGYGIQIASFQEAANLMQRCNDLKKEINKDILVQVADSKGTKVYRIIIGTFSNKEQAEQYKESLGHNYNGSFILAF